MERPSIENSDGAESRKNSRSLDLQSIYKSRVSKEVLSKVLRRKRRLDRAYGGGNALKKRKSRKEVPLSSFEKKSEGSLDEVCGGCGASSSSNNSDKHSRLITSSLSLDDNVFKIPRRRRGFVGRKKEGNRLSEPVIAALPTDSTIGNVDEAGKLSADSGNVAKFSKRKRKKGFDHVKVNRSRGLNVDWNGSKEDGVSFITNGDTSSRKSHRDQSKKKSLTEGPSSSWDKEQSISNHNKKGNDLHEYDEENLEQNAARMLSSRFDPNFTGFSSNRNEPMSSSTSGLPFLNSGHNCATHELKSAGDVESPLLDPAGRVLRPRKQRKQKGLSRKRRHFYEILSRDFDAHWVLNRRIKVFWPLDQSWYFGLVNYYDSERELHHVKYDDRDEEWIDLQNERFKLLLLPSEVPGKSERKKLVMCEEHGDKGNGNLSVDDHSVINNFMDSEPIISWLARSTTRAKPAPLGVSKKQKAHDLSPAFPSSYLSRKTGDGDECVDNGVIERDPDQFSSSCILADRFTDAQCSENHVMESNLSSKFEELPRVYFRRRYHRRAQQLCPSNSDHKGASESVNVLPLVNDLDDDLWDVKQCDAVCGKADIEMPYWMTDNAGLLILTIPLIELRQFKFAVSFPELSVLVYALDVDCWMIQTLLLLQHGTLRTLWPLVHLEMLFVDDIIGVRFVLFEGCLQKALALFTLVLTVFHEPNGHGNRANLLQPVASIRFKLSYSQNLKRQMVFAFYCYSKLKISKLLHQDRKIRGRSLLDKQLSVSVCPYDNIKALQHSSANHIASVCRKCSLIECLWKISGQDIVHMGIPKDSSHVNFRESRAVEKCCRVPTFALSFTAAPTFFLGLHIKLLLEHSISSMSLQWHVPMTLRDRHEKPTCLTVDESSLIEDCSSARSQLSPNNDSKNLLNDAARSKPPSPPKPDSRIVGLSTCNAGDWVHSCEEYRKSVPGISVGITASIQMQHGQCSHLVSQCEFSSPSCVTTDLSRPGKPVAACHSFLNVNQQAEKPMITMAQSDQHSSDLCWSMNDGVIRSPNPTAPRSLWHRPRNISSSSSFGYLSRIWSDGRSDFFHNGFGNGPKKPRTQVSYMMPFGDHDINTRHRFLQHKRLSHKRIRKTSEKREDLSTNSQRDLELLSCDANLLITGVDKGWRETGVLVSLQSVDDNEWRLAVKVSGDIRYLYKATEFLQPGTTNRYTHDMMWKGGKDWILEFPNRSQWFLFKEMHEECYNRNFRAALKKNIPIPGVTLIEGSDDNGTGVPFLQMSPKYHRQLETDVDMALNPLRILYDMDSDDEKWILNSNNSDVTKSSLGEISEEMFEKAINTFERFAYARQCDRITSDELDEIVTGVGPVEIIKHIYNHWLQKRKKKGMPLIRQLQPPLWEWYQRQMNEWNLAMTKAHATISNGCPVPEKPVMSAFCLKPRGLEMPNRGSKHRSQKKFSVTGHCNSFLGDQDGFHTFGRRSNGFAVGDEKVSFPGPSHEYSDALLHGPALARVYSPRDTGYNGYVSMSSSDGNEISPYPKLYRSRSRRLGAFPSSNVGLPSQRTTSNSHRSAMWQSHKHHYFSVRAPRQLIEQMDDSDLNEFRLRDASGAAQHALNMAKLKREKAQRLLYKADLAINKAAVALMTAEAMKAAAAESKGDG